MPSSCAQRSPVSWNSTVCGYFGLSASSTTNSRLEKRSDTCLVSKIVWSFPVASIPISRRYEWGLTDRLVAMRVGLLLISLTACKASIGDGMADGAVGSDGNALDTMMMAPLGPWGSPTPIDIPPVDDDDPTATGDLLELY